MGSAPTYNAVALRAFRVRILAWGPFLTPLLSLSLPLPFLSTVYTKWSEVRCGQVWWSILRICAHLTHPSAHTQQWTHTQSSGQPMLWRPESSWRFSALLKSRLSRGIEGGRECWLFTPPTHNSCRTWDSNPRPLGYKSILYPRLPLLSYINKGKMPKINLKKTTTTIS